MGALAIAATVAVLLVIVLGGLVGWSIAGLLVGVARLASSRSGDR